MLDRKKALTLAGMVSITAVAAGTAAFANFSLLNAGAAAGPVGQLDANTVAALVEPAPQDLATLDPAGPIDGSADPAAPAALAESPADDGMAPERYSPADAGNADAVTPSGNSDAGDVGGPAYPPPARAAESNTDPGTIDPTSDATVPRAATTTTTERHDETDEAEQPEPPEPPEPHEEDEPHDEYDD